MASGLYQVRASGLMLDRSGIAADAFADAIRYLKQEFQGHPSALAWLETENTINDIHTKVKDAEKFYREDEKTRKALPWLRKISTAVMFYGQIFDTLAQHHPEYLSLAWGTVKFVLMVGFIHAKMPPSKTTRSNNPTGYYQSREARHPVFSSIGQY